MQRRRPVVRQLVPHRHRCRVGARGSCDRGHQPRLGRRLGRPLIALLALMGALAGVGPTAGATTNFVVHVEPIVVGVGDTITVTVQTPGDTSAWFSTLIRNPPVLFGATEACTRTGFGLQNFQVHSCPPGTYNMSATSSFETPSTNGDPTGISRIVVTCGDMYGLCGTVVQEISVVLPGYPVPRPACTGQVQGNGCTNIVTPPQPRLTPDQKARIRENADDMAQASQQLQKLIRVPCNVGSLGDAFGELVEQTSGVTPYPITTDDLTPNLCTIAIDVLTGPGERAANSLSRLANDPPDPNFTELAVPVTRPTPDIGDDGLSDRAERLLEALDRLAAEIDAAVTSAERSQGAWLAGSIYWPLVHSERAAGFLGAASRTLLDVEAAGASFEREVMATYERQQRTIDALTTSRARSELLANADGYGLTRTFVTRALADLQQSYRVSPTTTLAATLTTVRAELRPVLQAVDAAIVVIGTSA